MSCCGNQRTQLQATRRPSYSLASNIFPATAPARRYVVCFEYIGKTALTVIGGATGQRYRFGRPCARVIVDPRDRPSLSAVPNLLEVYGA